MNKYYHILQISPGASKDEIKAAYRKFAKQYHPDINKSPDAQKKFIEITEAYEYLMTHDYQLPGDNFRPFVHGVTTYYYNGGTSSAVDSNGWVFEFGFNVFD